MKYIKTYESIESIIEKPQIGDYVIFDTTDMDYSNQYKIFLNTHIGKIISMYFFLTSNRISVKFEKNENEKKLNKNERAWLREEHHIDKSYIRYNSKNKEELELIINAEKYNL